LKCYRARPSSHGLCGGDALLLSATAGNRRVGVAAGVPLELVHDRATLTLLGKRRVQEARWPLLAPAHLTALQHEAAEREAEAAPLRTERVALMERVRALWKTLLVPSAEQAAVGN
jgi:hypothetical protein